MNELDTAVRLIVDSMKQGGKVLTLGVGGNATTAMHLAGEMAGKYEQYEDPLPCVCISENVAIITAITNDFGWEHVFSRQIAGLANDGDVVVMFSISTSGQYLINAINAACIAGCYIVLICGKYGGQFERDKVEILWEMDSLETPKVQEKQLEITHILCGAVKEEAMRRGV